VLATWVILMGYCRREFDDAPWPDPRNFVDDGWPTAKRELVVSYLLRGRALEQYRGLSPCRFAVSTSAARS